MQRSFVWAAIALLSIWVSVALISLNADDVIYGTERSTFPLVQMITWIWGAAASGYALAALVQPRTDLESQKRAWAGIAVSCAVIWFLTFFFAVTVPGFDIELLSNPIDVPMGQIIAPIAGVALTAVACQYVPGLTDVAYSAEQQQRFQ